MSQAPREQTQNAVGQEIIAAAETASGLSVVPPEEITEESRYSSGSLHQNQKWVYVTLSDNPDFNTFYESLPNSIEKLLSVIPYRDDVVLFRTYGALFGNSHTNYNIPQSENTPTLLSTIVDLCTYITEQTSNEDTSLVETEVTQEGPHTILIPKHSIPTVGSNSERLVLNWINRAGLVISNAKPTVIDSTVYYRCEIAEQHSPNRIKFFGQALQILSPTVCPSCRSQAVHIIESASPDREEQDITNLEYTFTIGCSSCLQYYEIPSDRVQTIFATEQLENIFNTIMSESTPTESYSVEHIKTKFRDSSMVSVRSSDVESEFVEFEDGEILYMFEEDDIDILVLYRHSLIDFDFTSIYDEDSIYRTELPRRCRICGEYNNTLAFGLRHSVTTFHPDKLFGQTYSNNFLGPTLCNSCVEDISAIVKEKLYEIKSEEELLTEYI